MWTFRNRCTTMVVNTPVLYQSQALWSSLCLDLPPLILRQITWNAYSMTWQRCQDSFHCLLFTRLVSTSVSGTMCLLILWFSAPRTLPQVLSQSTFSGWTFFGLCREMMKLMAMITNISSLILRISLIHHYLQWTKKLKMPIVTSP